MMQACSTLSGGQFVVMPFQIGETCIAGEMMVGSATNSSGAQKVNAATTCISSIGLATEASTFATAHDPDNADVQASQQLVVNPDLIVRARLSGSTTAAVALRPGSWATSG